MMGGFPREIVSEAGGLRVMFEGWVGGGGRGRRCLSNVGEGIEVSITLNGGRILGCEASGPE